MDNSNQPIIVEQSFDVHVETLWKALTDRDTMVQWYFDNIEEFLPQVGFQTQFPVHSGERTFTHIWKVTECIPGKKIVYNWSYIEYPGNVDVSFEVFEENGGSRLKLINGGLGDFQKDIPEFKRESCQGGWNYFIKGNLKEFLDGSE